MIVQNGSTCNSYCFNPQILLLLFRNFLPSCRVPLMVAHMLVDLRIRWRRLPDSTRRTGPPQRCGTRVARRLVELCEFH
jgi:hypothetical protein